MYHGFGTCSEMNQNTVPGENSMEMLLGKPAKIYIMQFNTRPLGSTLPYKYIKIRVLSFVSYYCCCRNLYSILLISSDGSVRKINVSFFRHVFQVSDSPNFENILLVTLCFVLL